ncbi:MAG: T9SS type A sorting domain-containing protein [Bacteroidetes bacterium]|nr:T9SS type A sorting domain-containing protein [Bacteroidota bacterium]
MQQKFNPAATITANGPVTFCQGQTVTLTANTFNGVTYQWQKNGLNINYTTPSLTVGAAGSWAVLESANGCTRLSNTIVTTINCREGLEEARAIDVQVFPVPVTTESVIRLDGIDNFEEIMFDLYDISGKKWSSIPCTGEVTILNDQNISNGIYLLRTMKGKEQLSVTKVVFAR